MCQQGWNSGKAKGKGARLFLSFALFFRGKTIEISPSPGALDSNRVTGTHRERERLVEKQRNFGHAAATFPLDFGKPCGGPGTPSPLQTPPRDGSFQTPPWAAAIVSLISNISWPLASLHATHRSCIPVCQYYPFFPTVISSAMWAWLCVMRDGSTCSPWGSRASGKTNIFESIAPSRAGLFCGWILGHALQLFLIPGLQTSGNPR
jgi:hypothetical protein